MKKEKIFNFDVPEENLGYLLWQVSARWQLAMNRGLGDIGLTQTQFVVLAALHWLLLHNESVTQNDIANHARIDKMMTSKILKTLQTQGFVNRQEHAQDTRAKEVGLTDNGIDILKKANAIVENIDTHYFSTLENNKIVLQNLLNNLMR
jgi:DNA-binding MarR family transcriptional regulator